MHALQTDTMQCNATQRNANRQKIDSSQCMRCMYIACMKIHDMKLESPTGWTIQVSHVRKNTLTHGAAWRTEKSTSGTEGA